MTLAWEPVPLASLTPYEKNPRSISVKKFEHLCKTIEAHPTLLEARPVIATKGCDWTADGTVIAGNMRLRAVTELGWPTVPTVWVKLTAPKAREWMLLDNVPFGEWDEDLLAETLYHHHAAGESMELTGFSDREWGRLVDGVSGDGNPGADEVPPPPVKARSKLGEVYELGPHRLVCGDATDPAVLEKLLDGAKVDCVWTDPPYGVDVVGGDRSMPAEKRRAIGHLDIENDAIGYEGIVELLRASFTVAKDATRPGGAWYVAAPGGDMADAFAFVLRELGLRKHTLVWVKDTFVLSRADYHYRHELIFYGWKPGGAHTEPPDRKQDSVWEIPRPRRSTEHPTMKPVELVEGHLRNSTNRGDVVLDMFAGSGTVLIAADRIGRVARVVELDPRYCDVIRDRYEKRAAEVAAAAA